MVFPLRWRRVSIRLCLLVDDLTSERIEAVLSRGLGDVRVVGIERSAAVFASRFHGFISLPRKRQEIKKGGRVQGLFLTPPAFRLRQSQRQVVPCSKSPVPFWALYLYLFAARNAGD